MQQQFRQFPPKIKLSLDKITKFASLYRAYAGKDSADSGRD